MAQVSLPHGLTFHGEGGGTIIMLVMDGLGGLPHPDSGLTELESAATPPPDALAARSSLGMPAPVGHGVPPGRGGGPGHEARSTLVGSSAVPRARRFGVTSI